MTPKFAGTFVVGHTVIRGYCDLFYDPERHGDLCVSLT